MSLVADDDRNLRCTKQAIGVDVPARLLQDPVTRSGEAGEMRHRGTGHQGSFCGLWNAEDFLDPSKGCRFKSGNRRRTDPAEAVLIPGTGEIVRGQCSRQSAASDKSEISTTCARHRGRRTK